MKEFSSDDKITDTLIHTLLIVFNNKKKVSKVYYIKARDCADILNRTYIFGIIQFHTFNSKKKKKLNENTRIYLM